MKNKPYRKTLRDLQIELLKLQSWLKEQGEKIVVEIYPQAQGLAGATGLTLEEIQTTGTIALCKFHRLMLTSALAIEKLARSRGRVFSMATTY